MGATDDKIWLSQYPSGVPAEVDVHVHASLKDLLEHSCARFASQLTPYKLPRVIEFRDTPLPKSPIGKILRRQLREPLVQAPASAA